MILYPYHLEDGCQAKMLFRHARQAFFQVRKQRPVDTVPNLRYPIHGHPPSVSCVNLEFDGDAEKPPIAPLLQLALLACIIHENAWASAAPRSLS